MCWTHKGWDCLPGCSPPHDCHIVQLPGSTGPTMTTMLLRHHGDEAYPTCGLWPGPLPATARMDQRFARLPLLRCRGELAASGSCRSTCKRSLLRRPIDPSRISVQPHRGRHWSARFHGHSSGLSPAAAMFLACSFRDSLTGGGRIL